MRRIYPLNLDHLPPFSSKPKVGKKGRKDGRKDKKKSKKEKTLIKRLVRRISSVVINVAKRKTLIEWPRQIELLHIFVNP